jgi:GT2 family glycosyltransferase
VIGSTTIDVVIPNYNGRELLRGCLETLRVQTVHHRVIVVDDASTDGTPDMLAADYEEAVVVALTENRGFSGAVNAGIAAGAGEIVVLLNNDVECSPEFVERICEPFAGDPSVGSVAALLLKAGADAVDSLGLEIDDTLAPFPRYWGARSRNGALGDDEGLLGPVGGAAAYRRSALESVGGFDERIFAYNEDVDLALRLRAAGWRSVAAPDAVGVHLGSATFGLHSPRQVFHRGWSRAFLLRKYGLVRRPRIMARVIAGEATSVAWQLAATREVSGLRGRIAGWRAGREELEVPRGAVNGRLGFWEALRRRRAYRGG